MFRLSRLVMTISLLCPVTHGQSDTRQPDALAPGEEPPSVNRSDHEAKELLGSGLGEFVFIAGGEFTMGRNAGENEDERPEHRVELSSFYVGKTPVTNAQFVRFLNEADIKPDEYLCAQAPWVDAGITLQDGKWACVQGEESAAACGESWILAEKYCAWLSKVSGRKCRLPTEAEWEYVCRGKEGRRFPWGENTDELGSKIWGWGSSTQFKKAPVGSYPKGATPEGVCDLIGYMDEMCSDWYDPEYYAKSPGKNPPGPSEPQPFKDAKVTRGGLQRPYTGGPLIVRILRDSQFLGVLPNTYLPRGWSRDKEAPPTELRFVYGRLGLRVVVEEDIASKQE